MRFKFMFQIGAAVASILLAPHVLAETPASIEVDAATLGRLDALLTLCAKADTKNRTTYEKYRNESIVFGEGTDKVVRVEGSDTPEYKEAYAAVIEAAGKAGRENVVAQCRRAIGAEAEKRN